MSKPQKNMELAKKVGVNEDEELINLHKEKLYTYDLV
jgi:hypothetical protein